MKYVVAILLLYSGIGTWYHLYTTDVPEEIQEIDTEYKAERDSLQNRLDSLEILTKELIFEIDSMFPVFMQEQKEIEKIETAKELRGSNNAELDSILTNARERLRTRFIRRRQQ